MNQINVLQRSMHASGRVQIFNSGFSDLTVLISTIALSSVLTAVILFTELVLKLSNGIQVLPPLPIFIYLGAQEEDVNMTVAWNLISRHISSSLLVTALLVYKILKMR